MIDTSEPACERCKPFACLHLMDEQQLRAELIQQREKDRYLIDALGEMTERCYRLEAALDAGTKVQTL